VFAIESFMDELAAAAGIDPVAFPPRAHQGRARACRDRGRGQGRRLETGREGNGRRGRGIGYARYKTVATYIAVIAEVEVNRRTGIVKVPRIWSSADAGRSSIPTG